MNEKYSVYDTSVLETSSIKNKEYCFISHCWIFKGSCETCSKTFSNNHPKKCLVCDIEKCESCFDKIPELTEKDWPNVCVCCHNKLDNLFLTQKH